jgi:hypothetical protein
LVGELIFACVAPLTTIQLHDTRCACDRTAGVQAKTRELKLAGSRNDAGSDLLSHTAAELARRPRKERPCSMGNGVLATELPAYTRKIMPAATYSPTQFPMQYHRR